MERVGRSPGDEASCLRGCATISRAFAERQFHCRESPTFKFMKELSKVFSENTDCVFVREPKSKLPNIVRDAAHHGQRARNQAIAQGWPRKPCLTYRQ
jgi:hypothetical protein